MITGIINRQNSIEKELINELNQLDKELNQLEKGGEIKKEAKERDKTQLRTVLLEKIKAFCQKANENNQSKLSEKANVLLKNLFSYEFNQLKVEFTEFNFINKEAKEDDKRSSKAAVIEKMQFFCEKTKNNNQVQLFKRMNEFLGIALSKDDKEAALKYWENAEEYGSIHLAMNDLKGLSKDNPQDENRKKIQRSIIILKKYLPKKNETKCHHEKISKCEDCGAAKALLASIYLNNLEKSRKVNAKNLLEEARATGIDIPRIIKAILLRDGCPQHDIERDEIASFELLKEYENENVLRENDSRHGRMWYLLGICYQDGRGVAKDEDKGNKYLEIADKLGFKPLNNGFFNDAPSSLPVQQVTTEEKPKTASQKPSIRKTRSKKIPAENPVTRVVKSVILSRPVVWVGTTFLVTPTQWAWAQITSACRREKTQLVTWEETTLQSTKSTEKEHKSEKQPRKKKSKPGSSGKARTAKSKATSSSTSQNQTASLAKPSLKTPVIVIPKASETSLTAKDSPKPIVKSSEASSTAETAATTLIVSAGTVDAKNPVQETKEIQSSESIQQPTTPKLDSPTKITQALDSKPSSPDATKLEFSIPDAKRGSITPDASPNASPILATTKIVSPAVVAPDSVTHLTTKSQQATSQTLPSLKPETKKSETVLTTPVGSQNIVESKEVIHQAEDKFVAKIPARVKEILWDLHSKGHVVEVTGGAIRDLILDINATPNDWDMVTSATPNQLQNYLKVEPKRGLLTVFTLEDKSAEIDITPFHKYDAPFKLSESTETEVLKNDGLYVRISPVDWINLRIKQGSTKEHTQYEIVDKTGQGITDLEKLTVRATGNPNTNIQHNWMNMIRFVYLSCKLRPSIKEDKNIPAINFQLEETTRDAIRANACNLVNFRGTSKYFQMFGYLLKIMAFEPARRHTCLLELSKFELLSEMLKQVADGFNQLSKNLFTDINQLTNAVDVISNINQKLHQSIENHDLISTALLLAAGANPHSSINKISAFQKLEMLSTAPKKGDLATYKILVGKLLETINGKLDPKKLHATAISLLDGSYLKSPEAQSRLQQTNVLQLQYQPVVLLNPQMPPQQGYIVTTLVIPPSVPANLINPITSPTLPSPNF